MRLSLKTFQNGSKPKSGYEKHNLATFGMNMGQNLFSIIIYIIYIFSFFCSGFATKKRLKLNLRQNAKLSSNFTFLCICILNQCTMYIIITRLSYIFDKDHMAQQILLKIKIILMLQYKSKKKIGIEIEMQESPLCAELFFILYFSQRTLIRARKTPSIKKKFYSKIL